MTENIQDDDMVLVPRALLRKLVEQDCVDECQECAIGQEPWWPELKRLAVAPSPVVELPSGMIQADGPIRLPAGVKLRGAA